MADGILLVLGVTEGRQFPKRAHHQLVVEANFDSELLCTDMIKHKDSPKFNTELAWEIDKKALHQHRLQRTPLKVQVFSIEDSTMKKELIGYCLLDLRSATADNEKKKLTWHSLLGSKHQKSKPEIRVSLSTESDKVRSSEVAPQELEGITEVDISHLDVVLDDERGYYLIGPESESCEVFKLSISIGGARNLAKLLPSDESVKTEDGFYFYYSLFDNDVTNETFYDLMSTRMPTERATVRLFTTPLRLEKYLRKVGAIVVYLCSNATSLGQATVSLLPLISSPLGNQDEKVEGLFPLIPTSTKKEDATALVGVSVVLSKEEQEPPQNTCLLPPNANLNIDISATPEMIPSPPLTTPKKSVEKKAKRSPKKLSPALVSPIQEDKSSHHIIFSIDIRSIANMDIQQPVYCFCRYTYPFFGSFAPILTNPAVLVQRNSEVLFPQSFCKFEFASTLNILQTKLTCDPLIVEIWTKDANVKDQLFGVAQVNLTSVLATGWKESAGKPIVKSEKVPVFSASDKPSKKVATIHVVLGFEDKGGIVSKELPKSQARGVEQKQQQSSISTNTDAPSELTSTAVAEKENASPVPARETQEYQVAMALEMWRQQQEEHFNAELTSKENQHMKVIAEEWKQRDLEREVLVKRKLQEYQTLEIKLKKTLEELDGRERKVLEFDEQLQRKEKLLAEEYNRKGVELAENSRKMKEEFEHQLGLERRKCADAEARSRRLEAEQMDLQQQMKEKDRELFALKESLLSRPEVKMQSDMNLLLLEKNELERKVDSITKSKVHYKQQWGRALRELARVKLNEQEAAQARLKKQQDELNHMKMRYMAEEEKKVMNTEKEDFKEVTEDITKKLQQLQSAVEAQEKIDKKEEGSSEGVEESVNKARIAKLIEERDILLQTGVYTLDDRVISQLDEEIQQLIHVDA